MWKNVCLLLILAATCSAGPLSAHQKRKAPAIREEPVEVEMPEQTETEEESSPAESAPLGTLTLPSNATSIRSDITDNFSCANKTYGYYADVENDCQIFHVCLPVTYADGRENTFRWSFICPEETIFSQESFTCMRREDMTIECQDSSRYYELNGNFGGAPAEEESKPTPVESEQPEEEEEKEVESKPVEEEPEVEAEPEVEPVKPVKPVKVQKPKPNRRKPQPQRKVPVPVTAAPVVEAAPEPVAPVVVKSKPEKPQRFSLRPNKERPQGLRPAIAAPPLRNEIFNGIRKRPAIFNTPTTLKPVEEVVESEPAVTEPVIQLSEPQPTLKLQTMFAEHEVIPVEIQEPEVQASEQAVTFVQPEPVVEEVEPTNVDMDTKVEDVKPIEAIEEIPAVIVERLEESMPQENEKITEEQEEIKVNEEVKTEEEAKPVEEVKEEEEVKQEEEVKPEEEIKNEEVIKSDEEIKPEEELKPEELIKPEEEIKSEEEIKPEEEIKHEEEIKPEEPIQQEEEVKPQEEIQPEEEPEVPAKVEEIHEAKPEEIKSEPAIVETSNSQEEALSLETLEAAKPADAPESMPATPEMEQHSPLVEEILDNTHDGEAQESLGGFKPVDPVMAAEAEQLITDFLNTLKKNEEKSETDMGETSSPVENADVSIEETKLPEPEIVDKNASVEEHLLEETEDKKIQKPQMMQDSPIINIKQVQHMPMDYQIPVKVIPLLVQPASKIAEESDNAKETAPEALQEAAPEEIQESASEEVKQETNENIQDTPAQESSPEETKESNPEETKETTAEEIKETAPEVTQESEDTPENPSQDDAQDQGSLVTAAYMPSISIDDIVELVKERLDQTPKKDQMAPMELILTPGAAEPMTLIQSNPDHQVPQEAQPTEEKDSAVEQEEEQILPIYKRISDAEPAMSKVQTLPVTVSKVETETLPETESAPEVREPKMDARKRRFLFRADAR
ncbi:titin [Drosophila biarmipes]|uniref:titin n=1 Tax=Drosophila biarmipes TaxID=125945 RepID=UPI0007E7F463|nr:titin [Drosophila biarmipes]